MPYALFRYDPEEEFELRKQVTLLETRLSQKGKRIKRISLAECLDEAMRSQRPLEEWFAAEREQGVETIVETVHSVLSEYAPLVDLVAARMPEDPDPLRDVVFILRTGALFPGVPDLLAPRAAQGPRPRSRRFSSTPATSMARRACASWGCSTPSTTTARRSSDEDAR